MSVRYHVHPGANQLAWDIGFLLTGAALIAIGAAVVRKRAVIEDRLDARPSVQITSKATLDRAPHDTLRRPCER